MEFQLGTAKGCHIFIRVFCLFLKLKQLACTNARYKTKYVNMNINGHFE
jgi:hypothetical protein